MTWWEGAAALAITYIITTAIVAAGLTLSTPKSPKRLSYSQLRGRAVQTRDVLLPAGAAAVLSFFVSMIASFVHEDFSSPLALRFGLDASSYLYLAFVGAVLSFVALALMLEKIGIAGRDVTRHPASINRAAELLGRGREIDDLDATDLERNLANWKLQQGKSAARVILGGDSSPRLNTLLWEHEKTHLKEKLPRWFWVRFFVAKTADFWWTGAILLGALVTTSGLLVVTNLVELSPSEIQPDGRGRAVLSLCCVLLQILVTLWLLRADAKRVVRAYRIDRIELAAAERRVAALRARARPVAAPRRGFVRRILDAVRDE